MNAPITTNGNGRNGHSNAAAACNGHAHAHAPHEPLSIERILEAGDMHAGAAASSPIRPDAFDLSDDEKIARIEAHFREILHTLGLDLNDDSLAGTPYRVAKMYVKELFQGMNPANEPRATQFQNQYAYHDMLLERDITLKTFCEHHFLPIVGRAHVAYFPAGTVVGLSKLNRIVEYYARRPQVQERLANQIADHLQRVLGTEDVAVVLDARHFCVLMRGVEHDHSSTVTPVWRGKFRRADMQERFMQYLAAARQD